MIPKFLRMVSVMLALFGASLGVHAATAFLSEVPNLIRVEQYTGVPGGIYFWRMPSPGTSVFPGTSCTWVSVPSQLPEQASRFLALYMFAKTNNTNIFYYIDTSTCNVVTFGMEG